MKKALLGFCLLMASVSSIYSIPCKVNADGTTTAKPSSDPKK